MQNLRKRRDEKKYKAEFEKLKTVLFANSDKIFVSFQDSVKAGNCEFGTKSFAKNQNINLEKIGAVRADVLLKVRADNYAIRACIQATRRFIRKNM